MTREQWQRQQRRERERQRREQEKAHREHIRQLRKESYEAARGPLSLPFLVLVLVLTAIGLIMLFSASFPSAYYINNDPTHYFVRQGIFAVGGLVAMAVIGKINYQRFRGLAKLALYGSIVLLVLVIIPGNPLSVTRNNATRWLGVGDLFTFQPSELAKLGVILYFSDDISRKKDKMQTFRQGILPYVVILGRHRAADDAGAPSVRYCADPGHRCRPHAGGRHPVEMGGRRAAVGSYRRLSGVGCHGLRPLSSVHVAGPLAGRTQRGLPDGPELPGHRLRRIAGCGPGQEPPEVPLST